MLVALLLGTAVADARKNKRQRRQRRKARVERVQRNLQPVPLISGKTPTAVANSLLYVAVPKGVSNEVISRESMTVWST